MSEDPQPASSLFLTYQRKGPNIRSSIQPAPATFPSDPALLLAFSIVPVIPTIVSLQRF
jgi:hypothetical protein